MRFRLALFLCGAATSLQAQTLDSTATVNMKWRNIGPANFMGRLADVVGIPGPSKTVFVAAAAGGVWKSTNNGQTWRPVFDNKRVASMGALAIAPSDTQQVWLGTGEPHSRNSIEPGAGIYKSVDGGITWKFMGLEKTQHIGRIAVDPRNPNVVWVAALGAAWRSNSERGLYKTMDGGTTWELVKFISDKAGFVDVALDPRNPDVVYAAAYERLRTPYSLKSGGPGSALFKSADGGKTWSEITGNGFPTGPKGRIGLAIAASNPDYVYAMVEAARPSKDGKFAAERVPPDNGLYRSTDAGKTWEKTNNANVRPFYYSQVRVDPRNPNRVYFSSTQLQVSDDGGKTSKVAAQAVHVDDHGLWIDPNDPERFFLANDGGVAITFDKGGNFVQGQNLPLAQFYEVSYDMAVPYNVCSGAQDNGTWCGPSRRKSGAVNNAYWFTISGGDGFYTAQDPTNPDIAFGESQGGNVSRVNVRTGERAGLRKPSWQDQYKRWEDSIAIVRGDITTPATKQATAAVNALKAKQRADSMDLALRFNWNSPFFLSPHNPRTFYFAGNRVLKSTRQGDDLFLISPDLSKQLAAKIDTSMNLTGGITLDATGAETYGTVVTLAESYLKPGLLLAGTDDGNVWKSPNDGASWENLTGRFPGLPHTEIYVSRVEPSHFDTLTFWVTFDNHRNGDFTPYLYATNDGGRTFRSVANNLPKDMPGDFLHVVREDVTNPNLLFVGSSVAVYASLDKGATWAGFMTGMPTVPIYDLKIHPRDRELIAATHGRGLWIADITPLQQMDAAVLASATHLFAPRTAFQWGEAPNLMASGNGNAQMFFAVPSPAYGADIWYRIGACASGSARVIITGAAGDTLANLSAVGTPGMHSVTWNFRAPAPAAATTPLSPSEKRDSVTKATRAPVVLDSLTKAGYDSTALARAKQLMNPTPGAGFGGRGGGGGGQAGRTGIACERPLTQWETFCARPGEGSMARSGTAPAPAAAFQRGPETANVRRIFDLIGLKMPAPAGRGGFGGFGGGSEAGAGSYLVTLKVGDKTYQQLLRIERVSGSGTGAGFPFGDDDDR
ncbi:MAG: WD40/YVTN/BNR-like repeat-containing protein [Gemmatimonadaceae bacterium]